MYLKGVVAWPPRATRCSSPGFFSSLVRVNGFSLTSAGLGASLDWSRWQKPFVAWHRDALCMPSCPPACLPSRLSTSLIVHRVCVCVWPFSFRDCAVHPSTESCALERIVIAFVYNTNLQCTLVTTSSPFTCNQRRHLSSPHSGRTPKRKGIECSSASVSTFFTS